MTMTTTTSLDAPFRAPSTTRSDDKGRVTGGPPARAESRQTPTGTCGQRRRLPGRTEIMWNGCCGGCTGPRESFSRPIFHTRYRCRRRIIIGPCGDRRWSRPVRSQGASPVTDKSPTPGLRLVARGRRNSPGGVIGKKMPIKPNYTCTCHPCATTTVTKAS